MQNKRPPRWQGMLFAGLIAALLTPPAWAEPSLRDLLDRVWERATQARVAESRVAEAEAGKRGPDSLIAGAPALNISRRNDRFNQDRGLLEQELGIAIPLWLPGQRGTEQALATRASTESEAALAATRLALAGELRGRIWDYAGARAEAELMRERLALAEQLEASVAKREASGDLARSDLLLAREETLAARAAMAAARTRERLAQERYRLLTGLEHLPTRLEETGSSAAQVPSDHPRLQLAEAATERARAGLQAARDSSRDAPQLSLGVKQSRDDHAAPSRNSLGIGLTIPFATEGRNAPRIAAANSALIRAEAEQRQTLAEVEGGLRDATAMLENATIAAAAARERAAIAAERQQLMQRAFDLGELSLLDLMRVRSAANEARLDAIQAGIALASANAHMNQAKGIVP